MRNSMWSGNGARLAGAAALVGLGMFVAARPAAAQALSGTASWEGVEAGFASIFIQDFDTGGAVSADTSPGGGAILGAGGHSISYDMPIFGSSSTDRIAAFVSFTTGSGPNTGGVNEPGIQFGFSSEEFFLGDGAKDFTLPLGLGTIAGEVKCLPGATISGGTFYASAERQVPGLGMFSSSTIELVSAGGAYVLPLPSGTVGFARASISSSAGDFVFQLLPDFFGTDFSLPADRTVTEGATLALDLRAEFTSHFGGDVSWHGIVATSGIVVDGNDTLLLPSQGGYSLSVDPATGLSGTFDVYSVPHRGTPSLFAEIDTCGTPGGYCGMFAPGETLRFPIATFPHAELDPGYAFVPVGGQVTVEGATLAEGGAMAFQSDGSTPAGPVTHRVLVSLVAGGYHSALVGEGFVNQSLRNVTVLECAGSPTPPEIPVYEVVEGHPLTKNVTVKVFTGEPGSIAGTFGVVDAFRDLTAPPGYVFFPGWGEVATPLEYMANAGLREPIFDCAGSQQAAFASATDPGSSYFFPNLTPGPWGVHYQVVAFATLLTSDLGFAVARSSWSHGASDFVDVPAGGAASSELALEDPAFLVGTLSFEGWDLGPFGDGIHLEVAANPSSVFSGEGSGNSFLGDVLGPPNSPVTFARPPSLPVRLMLDPAAGEWRLNKLWAEAHYSTQTVFETLRVRAVPADAPVSLGHVTPGQQPLPRLQTLSDVKVAHWTVSLPFYFFAEWSGGDEQDGNRFTANHAALVQSAGFAGATSLEARLAGPARYHGSIQIFGFDFVQLDLDVEVADRDSVTQSSPLSPGIFDREPAPGAASAAGILVSATITDPDGLASATIAGAPVTAGAGGAVHAFVPLFLGPNEVPIVATDAVGDVTTAIRHHDVPADVNGLLEPIRAPMVAVAPNAPPPSLTPPDKAVKLGSTLPVRFQVLSQGAPQGQLARYRFPPRIRKIERLGEALALATIDPGVANAEEDGIPFHLTGDGVWSYNLRTRNLGAAGTYRLTIETPWGDYMALIVVKN